MDSAVAMAIANTLNHRGFVLHDDVDTRVPVMERGFASYIRDHESLLRSCGYTGGKLDSWTSGFRHETEGIWSYGVVDGDWYWEEQQLHDAHIDAYVFSINDGFLERSGLLVRQLRSLMLNIRFACSCGHVSTVPWGEIERIAAPTKPLFRLTGRCSACGKHEVKAEHTAPAF